MITNQITYPSRICMPFFIDRVYAVIFGIFSCCRVFPTIYNLQKCKKSKYKRFYPHVYYLFSSQFCWMCLVFFFSLLISFTKFREKIVSSFFYSCGFILLAVFCWVLKAPYHLKILFYLLQCHFHLALLLHTILSLSTDAACALSLPILFLLHTVRQMMSWKIRNSSTNQWRVSPWIANGAHPSFLLSWSDMIILRRRCATNPSEQIYSKIWRERSGRRKKIISLLLL